MAAADVPVELRGTGNCSRQVHNFGTAGVFEADSLIACEAAAVDNPPPPPGGGSGGGGGGGGAPDGTAPDLGGLTGGKIRTSLGGSFNYNLSEGATVTFTIEKQNKILEEVDNPDHSVLVTAQQWSWTFSYLGEDATGGSGSGCPLPRATGRRT